MTRSASTSSTDTRRFEKTQAFHRRLFLLPINSHFEAWDRLWSGVDWPIFDDGSPNVARRDADHLPLDEIISASQLSEGKVIRFERNARVDVFTDCLFFSVVTITTLGYGDISPRTTDAKIASMVEVVSGVSLFAVALGMLFGNWWAVSQKSTGGDYS
jgi:ion channel